MTHKGSCHCGAVAFEVDAELTAVVACNCSICSRKGSLLWAVPRTSLRVDAAEESLGTYTFGRRAIAHRFCRTCGMQPFSEDSGDAADASAYVNIRCLEGVDPAAIETIQFDGRSH